MTDAIGTFMGGPSRGSPSARDQDSNLVNALRVLYQRARDSRNVRKDAWLRNLKLVLNTASSAPSSSWVPRPRDSECYPILSSVVGWMTDQTPTTEITPAADPNSEFFQFWQQAAHDLEQVLNTNNIVQQADAQVKLVLWDALMFQMGVFKVTWDSTLDGGLGNACMKRVDPWTWYPDPSATNFDNMEYCVEVAKMSLAEVYRRWPDTALVLEASSGAESVDERPTYGGISGANKPVNPGPINSTTGTFGGSPFNTTSGGGVWAKPTGPNPYSDLSAMVTVYTFWVRENEEFYLDDDNEDQPELSERHVADYWRCIVVANNQILMNEKADDLWCHGRHPYVRYVFEDVGEMYGISLVDHLAQPQIYINRLLTAMQQNAELIGNPIFLESAASGLARVSTINRPGQRLSVASASAMNKETRPDWLRPPEIPQFVSNLVTFWIQRMENISGISGMVKGATPTGRNSQQVISSIQDAAFVRIRSALKNLEWSLKSCYQLQADLVIEYFTERRLVAVLGPEGERASLVLHPRHFNVPSPNDNEQIPLKYSLVVEAGATRSTSRQSRMDEADKGLALGVLDEEAWLQAHNYPNYKDVLKRVLQRKQDGSLQPAGQRQKAGRKEGPGAK